MYTCWAYICVCARFRKARGGEAVCFLEACIEMREAFEATLLRNINDLIRRPREQGGGVCCAKFYDALHDCPAGLLVKLARNMLWRRPNAIEVGGPQAKMLRLLDALPGASHPLGCLVQGTLFDQGTTPQKG